MSLDYQIFDPSACQFPKPRVPVLPSTFDYSVSTNRDQILLDASLRHYSRGRYALGEAYRLAGLGRDSALLAPAYHCVTMLDPALAVGAQVQLYSLRSDLSPDIDSLNQIYVGSLKPIKALLATHFFGFIQDFSSLKQWCDDKGVILIEDCSHILFIERYQASGAGIYGKFIASSPYKFFPCADGGLLYAPEANFLDSARTVSAGFLSELHGIKSMIEKSRLPKVSANDIDLIDRQLESLAAASLVSGKDQRCAYPAQSPQYSIALSKKSSLRSSRWVVDHSSITQIVGRRRENYAYWLKAIAGLPNCHALYPELHQHVIPYMFPLYINSPMPHFYWLKLLGVPVWRWDEMAISNCPAANDSRLHLLHLPCHQSLSEEEMRWMTAVLAKVLTIPAVGMQ